MGKITKLKIRGKNIIGFEDKSRNTITPKRKGKQTVFLVTIEMSSLPGP
jgi:hypothetical protein